MAKKSYFVAYISVDNKLFFYAPVEKYMGLAHDDIVYVARHPNYPSCIFILKRTKQGKGLNPHIVKEKNGRSIRKYLSCPDILLEMGAEPLGKYQATRIKTSSYKGVRIDFAKNLQKSPPKRRALPQKQTK